MQLAEDEITEKYAKPCGHCDRKVLLTYEFEWTCISCAFNVVKGKLELSEIPGKKINFINRLKYAEQKIFCICVTVYKIYESNDYDKLYEVLFTLKNKKIKINIVIIEKYKGMLEDPKFEQDH